MLLSAGLATVPDHLPPHMERGLFAQYTKLMNEARSARRGLFAPDAARHVRHLRNLSNEELTKLGHSLSSKEALIRVERVLTATVLIVSSPQILGSTQVAVHMTGITSKEVDVSEVSTLSKMHTERFLLNRNVNVRFDGVDAFSNILISVISTKGSFQEELLSRGLATINSSTISCTTLA
uniref:Aspartyl/glutamyl-tRNA(Asn/Gln) amidotransferase subunit B n=1 Tax=Lygus hesperus TaxID=30085 RepID=A0A0A9X0N1_LYGHE